MRKLVITLAALSTLAVAAIAGAALPTRGAFAGTTSLRPINGFNDIVTFSATSTGQDAEQVPVRHAGLLRHWGLPGRYRSIRRARGKGDDQDGHGGAERLVPRDVEADASGSEQQHADDGGHQGHLHEPEEVSGTISISQSANGDVCGPTKMKFTAAPGTPSSLGLNG